MNRKTHEKLIHQFLIPSPSPSSKPVHFKSGSNEQDFSLNSIGFYLKGITDGKKIWRRYRSRILHFQQLYLKYFLSTRLLVRVLLIISQYWPERTYYKFFFSVEKFVFLLQKNFEFNPSNFFCNVAPWFYKGLNFR